MRSSRELRLTGIRWFALVVVVVATRCVAIGADEAGKTSSQTHPLFWDALEKSYDAKPGDEAADFTYSVQNRSQSEVEILELRPSCGCTVAEMPKTPWVLKPGEKGSFTATADFQGKHGKFTKVIHIISSAGTQMLTLNVNIPETEESRRTRNQLLATADRQAVFRGDCATCHVTPTVGKTGAELFQAACGICHTAAHRASMVPDLAIAREMRDEAYWRRWISDGKERSLMPAFAQQHGGPLSAAQIESLIAYALQHLPTEPAKK